MRPTLRLLWLPLALLAGCTKSSGRQDQVLKSATIGPGGGQLEVTSGEFAGLRLTVPPGALVRDVRISMVKPAPPASGGGVIAMIGGVGPLVRIDPKQVGFLALATLRLPYPVHQALTFGPGNVRARHTSASAIVDVDPPVVDVARGLVELSIESLGSFQVVPGPQVDSLSDYLSPSGTTVPLEDGHTFTNTTVLAPHLPNRQVQQWLVDDRNLQTGVLVDDWRLAARFSANAGWLEVWDSSVDMLIPEINSAALPVTTTTQVFSPPEAPSPVSTGAATLLARYAFEVPLRIGNREFRDVLRLRLITSWQRLDLPDGSSEQVFWFAPGVGLLQMQLDGVIRIRTDL